MVRSSYFKTMFLVAGLWNVVAGFVNWLLVLAVPNAFALYGMKRPDSLFSFHAMFWLIIAYGVGYLMVSRDISKNRGIVITGGVIGKIAFFGACVATLALGEANAVLLIPGAIDLVFSGLFIDFLIATRKKP